jgi:bifunctional non-homologous end joining protein LigD
MMPYADHRPMALVRCPQGDAQECFFQKQKLPGIGDAVRRARIDGHEVLYTRDSKGMLELVQFNTIEFHGWGATMEDPQRPDWIVMDLDPDVSLSFSRVAEAALELKALFDQIGLITFVKTTGGKGLHIIAPLTPSANWDKVKAFTHSVADALESHAPDRYVATMTKSKRVGKIFVDYLRNGRGATAILPYSPRARPNMTVAMPIAWGDVRHVNPHEFDVRSSLKWLKKRRKDPWDEFFTIRQTLPKLS